MSYCDVFAPLHAFSRVRYPPQIGDLCDCGKTKWTGKVRTRRDRIKDVIR